MFRLITLEKYMKQFFANNNRNCITIEMKINDYSTEKISSFPLICNTINFKYFLPIHHSTSELIYTHTRIYPGYGDMKV